MSIFDYSILILAVPLFAFLIIGLAGHKFKPLVAGITGTVGVITSYSIHYTKLYDVYLINLLSSA